MTGGAGGANEDAPVGAEHGSKVEPDVGASDGAREWRRRARIRRLEDDMVSALSLKRQIVSCARARAR